MAENVIRQDIIQIDVKTDYGGLDKLTAEMDKLKKSVSGGVDNSINKMTQGLNGLKKSVAGLGAGKGIEKLKDDLATGGYAIDIAKDKFKSFKNSVKDIATHPIKALDKQLLQLQMSTGRATMEFKKLAKTKVDKIKTGLTGLKTTLTGGEKGAKGFTNALKNIGKISVGKVVKGVTSVKNHITQGIGKAKSFAQSLAKIDKTTLNSIDSKITGLTKKLGSGLVSAAKKAALGIAAIGTAAGTAVLQSVSAYADYEQLIGGVDTLFKDSSGIVQKYANNAYKTAGLSANAYMETVTGFSASLLQSLGGDTAKAAKYADMAISDMADNANKMGTDMGSIQYAYQGFAKQNYTMLDNLKLGYGGTKTEMERLLKDAQKISGQKFDLSSYGDVVQAIHIIQENMDITGTTAKEAEKTISGSLASMKSAWGNLLTSFVVGGDSFDQCLDNMISSVKIFAGNALPAVDKALSNVFSKLGPVGAAMQKVVDKIKGVASNTNKMNALKGVFNSIKSVVGTVATAVGNLATKIVDFATQESVINTVKAAFDKVNSVLQWCSQHSDGLTTAVMAVSAAFLTVKGSIMAFNAVTAITKGIQIASTVAQYAYAAATGASVAPTTAATAAQLGLNAALLANPVTWIVIAIIAAIAALIAIIVVVVRNWDKIKETALNCWNAIKSAFATAGAWFMANVVTPVKNVFVGLWNGLKSIFSTVWNWVNTTIIQPVKNIIMGFIYFAIGIFTYCKEFICMVWGIIAGWVNTYVITPIVNFFVGLWNKIVSIVTAVWNTICSVWGFISGWVSSNIIQPIIGFFTNLWNSITNVVSNVWNTICSIWGLISGWVNSNIISPITTFFTGLWDKITNGVTSVKDAIVGAFSSAFDKVKEVWGAITGFFSGLWDGIKGIVNKIIGKGKEAVGTADSVKSKDSSNPQKHALGGLMTRPHIGMVAEAGAEMIIPLSKNKRQLGLNYWQQAGQIMGVEPITYSTASVQLPKYSPENSVSTVNSKYEENNTINPVFNLTVNGGDGSDARTLERKVKKWVKEAINDTFEMMSQKSPRLQEI